LVVDLLFTFVFFAVMFYYSPLLSWIVLGSIPLYVTISVVLTPLFRDRLSQKFDRGTENQAFLVESLTGIETLKALAVEPQMQRRWGRAARRLCAGQLPGAVARQFGKPSGAVDQQDRHGIGALFWRQGSHRW
jgi:ABC-type bacteriocin/lantibiotic exporter with double-glycine peptidase domain